ncbi:MAG: DNA/RNA nuclease SfsA [Tissierellia bacterium]|nr:DNA/RNA nuclease SfsA [Tissierellia bacterium]
MQYDKIVQGEFISRPNRFIAEVKIDNEIERVHVKNTGRCKELLIPGVNVYLEDHTDSTTRKTKYSLITVEKSNTLINMDSQVPNKVVYDALIDNKIEGLTDLDLVKREVTYKSSRFDIYFEKGDRKGFIEVKGVTLENNGLAQFPDAPTTRGLKHIGELVDAKNNGYEAYIFFLIQMEGIDNFKLNWITDPDFSKGILEAEINGVNVSVYDSKVKIDSIEINNNIPYDLTDYR